MYVVCGWSQFWRQKHWAVYKICFLSQSHWCFTVCGQTYHSSEAPPVLDGNQTLKHNQLYFVDAGEALRQRQELIGERVSQDMSVLDKFENEHSKVITVYKNNCVFILSTTWLWTPSGDPTSNFGRSMCKLAHHNIILSHTNNINRSRG